MRRCLAILLLILLPTQMSWAAVADYCMHESGAGADHVGHHDHADHRHGASAGDKAKSDGSASTAADFDCGHCHGTCASMPAPLGDTSPLALASHPVTPVEGIVRTLAQSPPERPQWLPLA